jgi:5-methylcytosine-specific restriction endonuclease McrA
MSEILNKQIVLTLNAAWQCMGFRTPRKAFEDLCSLNPSTGKPPMLAMDLTYETNEDGSYNTDILLNARPVDIDEWMTLPVRSCDLSIQCARREIRCPTIIICSTYNKIPKMVPKFSAEGVWQRDGGICQATGRKLSRDEGDLGHNVARAHGGQRTWDNIALLDKRLNRLQGTKSFADMGWTHIKPTAPKPRPIFYTINDIKHPSHAHFVERN